MAEMTYLQAISDGLRVEMRRDKRVFVIGEDVGVYGGAFKVTLGFQEEFGPWRVIDAPLSETAIVGSCTGAAIMGMRPGRRDAVRGLHLVRVGPARHRRRQAALPRRDAGADRRPAPVGRRLLGRAVPLAEPGELVRAHRGAQGRLPGDARGREGAPDHRRSRIRTRFSTSSTSTSTAGSRPRCPRERYTIPFGKARIHREGDDVTVVTWGAMVHTANDAAKELESDGVSVEILDLRTLIPGTGRPCSRAPQKTSKVLVLHEDTRTGGFGGEIAATIAEEAFEHLDAPIMRIAAPDTPVPFSPPLEKAFIPQVDDVVKGLKRAGRVLMATTRSRRRRHAADGRLRFGGDDHEVAQAASARRSRPTSRCSRSRPTRSTPGAEPCKRHRDADPRQGRRDRGRGDEARGDRRRGRRRR